MLKGGLKPGVSLPPLPKQAECLIHPYVRDLRVGMMVPVRTVEPQFEVLHQRCCP
jgi:hypothetical protein